MNLLRWDELCAFLTPRLTDRADRADEPLPPLVHKHAQSILDRHPNCVPVILLPKPGLTLKHTKYLIHDASTVRSLLTAIRHKEEPALRPTDAIFLLTPDGRLPSSDRTMIELYREGRAADGFLYIVVTKESAFGGRQVGQFK